MEMLRMIKDVLERVKAEDIRTYDFKGKSPLCDYVVIATVSTSRNADAAIGYLVDECKKANYDVKGIEGKNGTWILVDLHDVIVHIFTAEERANYDLDRLYMGIPTIEIK